MSQADNPGGETFDPRGHKTVYGTGRMPASSDADAYADMGTSDDTEGGNENQDRMPLEGGGATGSVGGDALGNAHMGGGHTGPGSRS